MTASDLPSRFRAIRTSARQLLGALCGTAVEGTPPLRPAIAPQIPPIALPAWIAPAGQQGQPFEVPANDVGIEIWGNKKAPPRFYFDPILPSIFERTLVLESFTPADGRMEWMFTGPKGGFTISADAFQIELLERHYDSPGFNTMPEKPARHPEFISSVLKAGYTGQLKALTVRLDGQLGLTILANGLPILQRECLLDVNRHQLAASSANTHACGILLSPPPEKVRIHVAPDKSHQTMRGFGGITSMLAYNRMDAAGKEQWWDFLCQYNLLIQREYPIGQRLNPAMDNWDRLEDAVPHYYGDNFAVGEISDFSYNRKIRGFGGQVWFEFWRLPDWMGEDDSKFTAAVIAYCREAQAKASSAPEIVGIQNEIKPADDIWPGRVLALRQALDQAGFSQVRLHMNDSVYLWQAIEWARIFRGSAEAWKAIDYSAAHFYDFPLHSPEEQDKYDARIAEWNEATGHKPFLSTEICINYARCQTASYRMAFSMGQLYHKNLVLMNAEAICYCWLLIDVEQPSYGWTRSLFVTDRSRNFAPTPSSNQLRVFGAFSRRVRQGMTRVDATSGSPDLLVSAFKGEGNQTTLILLNRSTSPVEIQLDWTGARFTEMECTHFYHENRVTPLDAASPEARGEIRVEPGSIVTLTNVPLGSQCSNSNG